MVDIPFRLRNTQSRARQITGPALHARASRGLNTPIWAKDPDGKVVTFANKASEAAFNSVYDLADKSFRARLDNLKASKVEYIVNSQATAAMMPAQDPNLMGATSYNFKKNESGSVNVLVRDEVKVKEGYLADELTGAAQFDEGKIGFLQDRKGVQTTIGYGMDDEIDTKTSELRITEAYLKKNGGGEISPDLALFKKYLDKGKPQKYFSTSEYGKMYKFAPNGTPGYGSPATVGALDKDMQNPDGQYDGAAFKANIQKDDQGQMSLTPGGANRIELKRP